MKLVQGTLTVGETEGRNRYGGLKGRMTPPYGPI